MKPALIDPITALAEYMSGPEVGHASIGLGMPAGGTMKLRERAERFFALRKQFGIDGYDSLQVCERKILRTLKEHV
jgi:hypothetical protein